MRVQPRPASSVRSRTGAHDEVAEHESVPRTQPNCDETKVTDRAWNPTGAIAVVVGPWGGVTDTGMDVVGEGEMGDVVPEGEVEGGAVCRLVFRAPPPQPASTIKEAMAAATPLCNAFTPIPRMSSPIRWQPRLQPLVHATCGGPDRMIARTQPPSRADC
jgi:hypothetical protein